MKSDMVFSNEYKISTTDFKKDKFLSEDILTYLIKEAYYNKLVSDIGDIDFNKNATNKTSLKEISNLFCDNIILYGLIKQDNIYYNKNRILIKESVIGYYNKTVKEVFNKHGIKLHLLNVKTKLPISINSNCNTVQQISKYEYELKDFAYISIVKVELAEIDFKLLIKKLLDILEELKDGIYFLKLKDLDITTDCIGNMDKIKIESYIENNLNLENIKIIENNNTVGINCLTFMDYTDKDVITRKKFYNKYICQLTSCSISSKYGNNIFSLLYNPTNKNLINSLVKCKDSGITRLEITIYSNIVYSYEKYLKIFNNLNKIKNAKIFYKQSYKNQFLELERNIKNSLLIYCKHTEIYTYVYYINNLTSKYITIQAKNKNITKEYIIEKHSFVNRICNYLEYDYDEENINIKLERYLKVNRKTHITKYNSFKSIIKEDINLEDFGFNFVEIIFTYNKDKLSLKLENNITKLDENFNVEFLTNDLKKIRRKIYLR